MTQVNPRARALHWAHSWFALGLLVWVVVDHDIVDFILRRIETLKLHGEDIVAWIGKDVLPCFS